MKKNFITKYGLKLLKDELYKLKFKKRFDIINNIIKAKDHGDLSENAEYDIAKEKQIFIENRISYLEKKILSSIIIEPNISKKNKIIVFSSIVSLKNLNNKNIVTYQIVGIDEANIKYFKISITSPIAKVLIGKSVGDIVIVNAPFKKYKYKILKIK